MKKMISMMMVTILALMLLTGCSSTKTTGSVPTDGSTSMEKVIGAFGLLKSIHKKAASV